MKIIDNTLNSKVEGANSFIQHGMITFFAKKPDDLPVARKIGDIVRVHRAVVREYKGRKQFNVNMTYNSSWCLFHSCDVLIREKLLNRRKGDTSMNDEDDQDGMNIDLLQYSSDEENDSDRDNDEQSEQDQGEKI